MDADLQVMWTIPRFASCVDCLLEPSLAKRSIAPMPCKHGRTFELANQRGDSATRSLATMIPRKMQHRTTATAIAVRSTAATSYGRSAISASSMA